MGFWDLFGILGFIWDFGISYGILGFTWDFGVYLGFWELFRIFHLSIGTTTCTEKLQKIKYTRGIKTRTADLIEQAYQSTSAHTTNRIANEMGME